MSDDQDFRDAPTSIAEARANLIGELRHYRGGTVEYRGLMDRAADMLEQPTRPAGGEEVGDAYAAVLDAVEMMEGMALDAAEEELQSRLRRAASTLYALTKASRCDLGVDAFRALYVQRWPNA